jgi:6-phosphogluconolactonase (cycloisomerase 2 family)
MKLSLFGRLTMALLASVALGLGMTACGGGTIAYIWVLGQQYNQVAGFKVDDYTGNLTTTPTSPFNTGGTMPVSLVVKAGGRFVYIINQGTTCKLANSADPTSCIGPGTGQSITEMAVGGDGTLTYQASYTSQGYKSMWAQFDPTGSYLYVLDQYAPVNTATPTTPQTFGAVTVFAADPSTGRLTLVTNSQTKDQNGLNTFYWAVGQNPFMMKTAGSCLLTLNQGQRSANVANSLTPYSVGSGGQLITATTGTQTLTTTSVTSINGNGSSVYLTDSEDSGSGPTAGRVFGYTIGSGCSLNLSNAGVTSLAAGTLNPSYSFIDNSGKFLYVLNYSNTNGTTGQAYSSMSAFVINSATTQLVPISGSPFTVGSGPVCGLEDTANKYIYVSNHNDGTITGKVIDPTTGNLSDLARGSTFNATGQASCLVLSGAVS